MAKSKSVWLCQTCAFEAPALEAAPEAVLVAAAAALAAWRFAFGQGEPEPRGGHVAARVGRHLFRIAGVIGSVAVLSAIGATPKQIKRSLRYEGLLIGLLGSALGVLVGVGLTFVLIAVLSAFGFDLPGSGIKIEPSQVVAAIVAGTLITFFSVVFPARRASRIEPIEALRAETWPVEAPGFGQWQVLDFP